MKKSFIFLSLIIGLIHLSYCQENSNSHSKADPTISIAATKMNVFYRGVDNPISICVEGFLNSELSYTIEGDGQIVETDHGLVVRNLINRKVQEVSINVFTGKGDTIKKLGEKRFRVKRLPSPDIYIATSGSEPPYSIPKNALLVNPYLRCQAPMWLNFEYNFSVLGFDMISEKDENEILLHSESNRLTQDMKDYIIGLEKEATVIFTNIRVKGPNDSVYFISSYNITIM